VGLQRQSFYYCEYLSIYLAITLGAAGLLVFQYFSSLSLYIGKNEKKQKKKKNFGAFTGCVSLCSSCPLPIRSSELWNFPPAYSSCIRAASFSPADVSGQHSREECFLMLRIKETQRIRCPVVAAGFAMLFFLLNQTCYWRQGESRLLLVGILGLMLRVAEIERAGSLRIYSNNLCSRDEPRGQFTSPERSPVPIPESL